MTTNCNYTLASFEKNRYFYGKLMTVRDFNAEQTYFDGKRYMLNRLIHGVGIVCGLEVNPDGAASVSLQIENENGTKFNFSLGLGMALDCCGREIVVTEDSIFEIKGKLKSGSSNYIYLKYKETPVEKVPTGSNASSCNESCCDNRIKEGFIIEINQTSPDCSIWDKDGLSIDGLKTTEQQCSDNCSDCKIFLAVVDDKCAPNPNEIQIYRNLVFTNPTLFRLIKKNTIDIANHISDHNNPHQVTAEQVKALKTISGNGIKVGNINPATYVSDINFVSTTSPDLSGKIDIMAQPASNLIKLTLSNDAVLSQHIQDAGIVANQDTSTGTGIATGHIRDNAVTTPKIADGIVTTPKLADNAVTNLKLADNAVTTPKIADAAVITPKLADNSVTMSKIVDAAVTTLKLADNAITNNKIIPNTIGKEKLNFTPVTGVHLAAGDVVPVPSGNINLIAGTNITIAKQDANSIVISATGGNNNNVDTVPLYRAFNPKSGDHFYTVSFDEYIKAIQESGYKAEGISCYVFPSRNYIIPKNITNPIREAIIAHIPYNTPVSVAQLVSALNMDNAIIQDNLNILVDKKIISKQRNNYIINSN